MEYIELNNEQKKTIDLYINKLFDNTSKILSSSNISIELLSYNEKASYLRDSTLNGNIKEYSKQGDGKISDVWNELCVYSYSLNISDTRNGKIGLSYFPEFLQDNKTNSTTTSNSLDMLGEYGRISLLASCSYGANYNYLGGESINIFSKTDIIIQGNHYFGSIRPVFNCKEE